MRGSQKTINIIRWITRILSILTALLFLVFFIGEADFTTFTSSTLPVEEWIMILFVPILLIIGMAIAWKKEVLGGIMIIADILLFNVTAMISGGRFNFELEFGFFLIIGFGFLFCGFATNRLKE